MKRGLIVFLATLLVFVAMMSTIGVKQVDAGQTLEANIYLPSAPTNINSLDTYEKNMGVKFKSVKWYLSWEDSFTKTIASNIHNHGAIPELTWEPSVGSSGVLYDDVLAGKYDSYLDTFATSVKSSGIPIRISLAPEANSSWVPWGTNLNPNGETHKLFWRYVVNRFRANGATNVSWIWSPNIHYYGEKYSSYSATFPGDEYVNFVGMDGYNWGTSGSGESWQSFTQVFSPSYRDLTSISTKKILIMETASAEVGGNKANWITDMFKVIPSSFPQIQGFTWFNINKETDWRIESSPASRTAFIDGYNSWYGTTPISSPTPSATPSIKPSQAPSVSPSPVASVNPSPSPTQSPEVSSTPSPSPIPSPPPIITPSPVPSVVYNPSVTPAPSVVTSPTPTRSIAPSPTTSPRTIRRHIKKLYVFTIFGRHYYFYW